jgi:hypothetical protein
MRPRKNLRFVLKADMRARDLEVAESAFEKRKRREAEIDHALRQENARHEAAVKNMRRLRELRQQRDLMSSTSAQNNQQSVGAADRIELGSNDPAELIGTSKRYLFDDTNGEKHGSRTHQGRGR